MFRILEKQNVIKSIKSVAVTTVLFGTLLSQSGVIAASEKKVNLSKDFQVSCSMSVQETDACTKVDDNTTMWIEGAHIYKIEASKPNKKVSSLMSVGSPVAEGSVNLKISERHLSIAEMGQSAKSVISKQIAYDKKIKNNVGISSVEMSNQAWDGSYTLKSTLKVKYDTYGSYGDEVHIYSASGSYTRAARNGVSVKEGILYYNSTGKIYKNGKFLKNGTQRDRFTSTTGTFTNKTLMGNTYYTKSTTLAGVGYTINASRGVSFTVTCTIV